MNDLVVAMAKEFGLGEAVVAEIFLEAYKRGASKMREIYSEKLHEATHNIYDPMLDDFEKLRAMCE